MATLYWIYLLLCSALFFMWLGTTLEFVIQRDRVGLSLPYQSSHSATFTDSKTTFTFIVSLSSIQRQTPQMSVTWGDDDDNEDAVSCQQRSHWHVVQFHSVWHNFNSTAAGAPVSAWSYLTNISTSLVHLSPTYLSSSRSHISVLHPLFVASWRYISSWSWKMYFRTSARC